MLFLAFVLFALTCAQSYIEQQALCALANSWTLNNSYPEWVCSNVSFACGWTGVECTSGQVSALRLYAWDYISGSLPSEIGLFPNIQSLQLFGFYDMTGTIPTEIGKLTTLTSLTLESMSSLSGTIPTEIGRLTYLSHLQIDDMPGWSGVFSAALPTEIGRLTRLNYFYFGYNYANGTLPTELGNWQQLNYIELSGNQFQGTIPTQIGNWYNVETVAMGDLQFNGTFPTQIGNWRQLSYFYGGYLTITGTIPTEIGRWTQAYSISFYDGEWSGRIPTEIGNLQKLQYASFAYNNHVGQIPTQIGRLPSLATFEAQSNFIVGTIPTQIGKLKNLRRFYLYDNSIAGTLPTQIGAMTSLTYLWLSYNRLQGVIPTHIGLIATKLRYLYLDYNDISGTFPPTLCPINNSSLSYLKLDSTLISGTIPTEIGRCTSLNIFTARSAVFNGTIPTYIRMLSWLTTLDLSSNIIKGPLPTLFPNVTRLARLELQYNILTGTVPYSYASMAKLTYMDFSANRYDIKIPLQLSAKNLTTLIWVPQDIDECANPKTARCPTNSNCTNGWEPILSYTCTCSSGYYMTLLDQPPARRICEDIDECSNGAWAIQPSNNTGQPCGSQDGCINVDGTFNCCPPGHTRNPVTQLCIDIDECATGLWVTRNSNNTGAPCVSEATCVNTIGSFNCCATGFIRFNSSCVDIDECATGQWLTGQSSNTRGPCLSQETCVNTLGSFTCCLKGFIRNQKGSACVDVNECANGDWVANCTSQDACVNTNGSFYCCAHGFTNQLGRCVDIDECTTGLWLTRNSSNTKAPCVSFEACVNTNGSFYCCAPGFTKDFNSNSSEVSCVDIDECATGLWATLPSNNTGAPCPSQDACQNYNGSFNCCPAGYHRDFANTDGPCIDINECLSASTVTCNRSDLCVNTAGSFKCCAENETNVEGECHPCFDDFVAVPYPRAVSPFPGLTKFLTKPLDDYNFDWQSCTECNGLRFYSRKQYSPYCVGSGTKIESCGYACPNQTLIKYSELVISTLRTEFSKFDFLKNIVGILFNTTITIETKKRANELSIAVPCGGSATQIRALIAALTNDIVPNGNEMKFTTNPTTCGLDISSEDASVGGIDLGVIIGIVVGITLFALLVALLVYKLINRSKLVALPKEVAWSFKLFEDSLPFTWEFRGNKSAGYHYKQLEPKSWEYRKASALFSSFGEYEFEITSITAVYNALLLTNFSNTYLIQRERNRTNPVIFGAKSWRDTENGSASEWVFKKYTALATKYSWNIDADTMILPACHGTNLTIAEKICETGFASLSSLDAGYFGKGIYFTAFSMYCVPYIAPKKQPTIIVSYLLPGNVYPVIEKVDGPHSLLGAAIKSGFNSHFVVTDRAGKCVDGGHELFNEIIVSQESQIVPAFIVQCGKSSVKALLKAWTRVVPSTKDRVRTHNSGLDTLEKYSLIESTLETTEDDDNTNNRFSMRDNVVYSDITMARQHGLQRGLVGAFQAPTNYETV